MKLGVMPVGSRRPGARRVLGVLVVEGEQVLHQHRVTLEAGDLGDLNDVAGAITQPSLLDDELDGRHDLLANDANGQVHARHEDHGLDAAECVSRSVGMHRRQGAVMTGVHGLQHVERRRVANLADDDAVRTHAERVADEVADRDLPLALHVGRA